jgi:cob(I)alamin adenosyltransferase
VKQGLIHLYTGDGKGKTTAALGLLLRAHGRGMRVVLAQFLKGGATGELGPLEKLGGVTILRSSRDFGFWNNADEQKKSEITRESNAILKEAHRLAAAGLCDLLVLDEICAAYNLGAVEPRLAESLIIEKPPALELVLTGRSPPPLFLGAADYITEFTKRKHPFDAGIPARKGIEY